MFLTIGNYNELEALDQKPQGWYLDGGPYGRILLPNRYCPKDLETGTEIRVFVFTDTEDRLIATTETPHAVEGEFAYMRVKDITKIGAFLDWGLQSKDLLLPFREQKKPLEIEDYVFVYVYLDGQTDRMIASTKLGKHLQDTSETLKANEEVQIMIVAQTDLGYKVIVNNECWGILYKNEIFKPINVGDKMLAYVKKVREDGRLDIALQKQGFSNLEQSAKDLIQMLQNRNGFLPLNDRSHPDEIRRQTQMSKKTFKKAIGILYKQKLIDILPEGVSLKIVK